MTRRARRRNHRPLSPEWWRICEVDGCGSTVHGVCVYSCNAHRCTHLAPETGRRCTKQAGIRGDAGMCQWCKANATRAIRAAKASEAATTRRPRRVRG